ncbi:MAG TPA: ATP-binding protein [Streptosporangiaceae bacterium]
MTQAATGAPHVHLLAGLNGAGKTTYAKHLQVVLPAVRFTQDEWLLRLHPLPFDDPRQGELTRAYRELAWSVAVQALAAGTDVVLDWNSWSRVQRAEWSGRAANLGHGTVLHYLRVPVETAIARAEQRTAEDEAWSYPLDAAAVRHMTTIFEVPQADEGFELRIVSGWRPDR